MSFIFQKYLSHYITILVLAITFSPSAQSSDNNSLYLNNLEIKAGAISFPPFYVVNSDQTLSGIFLDIMEKTLLHAKIKYRLNIYPTKRLYNNLKNGETDFFLGIKGSPEYDNHVLYSTTEISQIQLRVYATGDTPLPSTKEDLNNNKVITLRGYSYAGLITYLTDPQNNISISTTSDHRSAFLMLKNNRANYVINYKHPSEAALKMLTIKDLKYTNFYDVKIYFIVSKALPHAAEILRKLEQAYLELLKLGELEYIENTD